MKKKTRENEMFPDSIFFVTNIALKIMKNLVDAHGFAISEFSASTRQK